MNIVLYSTGCPKCNVLEAKLKGKKIEYQIENNEQVMIEKGFMSMPVLEVDGQVMTFKQAVDWVNNYSAGV